MIFLLILLQLLQPAYCLLDGDNQALLDFKQALNNSSVLRDWNASINMCSWPGIVCNSAHTHVASIQLAAMNLEGILCSAVGRLHQLESLNLSTNCLVGKIPDELANCSQLELLDLQGNSFQGRIPASLGRFEVRRGLNFNIGRNSLQLNPNIDAVRKVLSLQLLDLSRSDLHGNISTLDQLTGFMTAVSSDAGKIPIKFELERSGASQDFSFLSLAGNLLQGEIPQQLGNLTGLKYLNLSRNRFDGEIPVRIVKLDALQSLDLSENNFTGELPWNLGTLSLGILDVSYNNLSGLIPGNLNTRFPDAFPRVDFLQWCWQWVLCRTFVGAFDKLLGENQPKGGESRLATDCCSEHNDFNLIWQLGYIRRIEEPGKVGSPRITPLQTMLSKPVYR
ncbi:LRR receptor-like serine/threonine-protein kinase ERL1 [Selaginella moellendorffii]|uniref:LRR receptor-like serine/threonine-protein kinase ERL1 n=1 Tax=Selaginella moellendorffii TaxID=88036 RepID=UPI000D1C5196|nr:LRR receptor-like serine/threonine-protein kinase ERL1 [Selaginella moellendorffii]|eukprot:XP_024517432.1 LRR receptor-like serine/threonine-protein kinase ERL1 [Selaginella moellendorffii]